MYLKLTTTYDTNKWIINQSEFKKVVCVKYAWKKKQSRHNNELLSCCFKIKLTSLE